MGFGVKKHYLTLAVKNLNNKKHPVAGKKKEFVSTRFLDFARNDRLFSSVMLSKRTW